MAQKINIVLIDDISGTEISADSAETINFALDGTTYEIDLGKKNAKELRAALAPYIEAGRRIGRATKRPATKRTQLGPSNKEIRDWARSSGYDVPERGRIPGTIIEAFNAAN